MIYEVKMKKVIFDRNVVNDEDEDDDDGITGSEIDMKSLCNCKYQIRDFLIEYNIRDLKKTKKYIKKWYAIFIYSIFIMVFS